MKNPAFKIFLPYRGKSVIAAVEELNSSLNFEYNVTFPDGNTRIFNTNVTSDTGWTENGRCTELAMDVGNAIDYFLKYGDECEPYMILVAGKEFIVSPCISLEGAQVTFKVYHPGRNYLYELSLNENGDWTAATIDENLVIENDGNMLSLVEEFGKKIESKNGG